MILRAFHGVNSAFLPSSYSGIVVTLSWSLAVLTLVRHSLTSGTSLTRLSIQWVLSLDPSFIYWRLKYFSRLSSNVIRLHAFWKSLHSSPDISASLPSGISSGRISLPGFEVGWGHVTSFSQWVIRGSHTFHSWAKNSVANSKPSGALLLSGSAISRYQLLPQAGFWLEHDAMD